MTKIQRMKYSDTTSMRTGSDGSNRWSTRFWYGSLIAIIIAVIIISPVSAASKYMAGSPELSAYISGTNEVSPGRYGIAESDHRE